MRHNLMMRAAAGSVIAMVLAGLAAPSFADEPAESKVKPVPPLTASESDIPDPRKAKLVYHRGQRIGAYGKPDIVNPYDKGKGFGAANISLSKRAGWQPSLWARWALPCAGRAQEAANGRLDASTNLQCA